MRTIQDIEKSIDKTLSILSEMDKMDTLYKPLVKHLLPRHRQKLIDSLPLDSIKLKKSKWENQYKGGIDRCCGFDIELIE